MRNNLLLFITLFFVTLQYSYSQIEDCVGAYPVCGNGEITLNPTGTGTDDFANQPGNLPSCQFIESRNIWLRIKIKQAGSLGFDLIPEVNTGSNPDDYDFAIYGPDVPCDNLGPSIRCSSTNPRAAGVGGNTGMNETETDTSEGPGPAGNGYIHWLDNVQVGEVYYVLIDNFVDGSPFGGFQLNWTGTALLEDRISKENGGVDLGPDINLCDNETTTLDATIAAAQSYLWNTGDATAELEVDQEGEYIVTATNVSGCISKDTINITLIPAPIIDQVNATPNNLCEPVTDVLLSSSGSSGNYEWFNPSGNSIGTGNNVNLTNLGATDSGTYTLRVTRPNGCSDEESVEVVIHPLPQLVVAGNSGLCEGESATLSASGAATYQWIDPSGNVVSTSSTLDFPNLHPNQSGTYELIGLTEFGCEDNLLFDVFVSPELTVTTGVTNVAMCSSDPLSVTATANQANVSFEWTNPIGTVVGQQAQLFLEGLETTDTGNYTVTARNVTGCEASETIFVDIDQSYLFEEQVEQCPGTFFEIPQTGERIFQTDTIQVDLLTRNQCDSTYIWDVQFLPCSADQCTGFPTAFAPNGNNLNDAFQPIFSATCEPTSFVLKIFNRWGEMIYETNDHTIGWGGEFEDELAQQGFYLWQMSYTFPDQPEEQVEKSGGITLIR